MKSLSLILALAFLGIFATASAQNGAGKKKKPAASTTSKKPAPAASTTNGYEKTTNGLQYKFYKKGKGKHPLVNDIMTVEFAMSYKDSIINSTKNFGGPAEIPCMAPMFKGDVMEGLAMMGEGDSALFLMSVDSFFRGNEIPKNMKSGDFLNFNVKLVKVKSAEEVKKEQAMAGADQLKQDTLQIREYLKKNNIKAQRTASGLYYTFTKKGNDGAKAMAGKTVAVHYTGKLMDGKIFDSSRDRGEPISFPLGVGQVIPGWDEGIALLKEGDAAMLFIPSSLGYGSRGAGPIPANSILIFDVELMSVK